MGISTGSLGICLEVFGLGVGLGLSESKLTITKDSNRIGPRALVD